MASWSSDTIDRGTIWGSYEGLSPIYHSTSPASAPQLTPQPLFLQTASQSAAAQAASLPGVGFGFNGSSATGFNMSVGLSLGFS